ncbi:DUF6992 family protein [Pontibacter sp. G13]|uniref:DUF6992 family protein n=1 Tax=Pontibacter sp. G13 TaxID=3074898 RepID=UPI00288B859C|nr:hypothetical protein [Pontibacter sp. G13]WNJ16811.1 hypothetical protein RJD25_18260 [Pontibacter sp. G13]
MKWKWLLAFVLFGFGTMDCAWAQQEEWQSWNERRFRLNRINMYVLGGWAVGNIVVGASLRGGTEGSTRYFHEMNMFWNVVNLGLAGAGLYGSYTEAPADYGLWETIQRQEQIEKVLLFNLALNGTYIMTGAYLNERSRRPDVSNPDRLKGYGQSLMMQGGFLLLFDATQYLLHHHGANPSFERWISTLTFNGQSLGISVWI